MSFVKQKDQVAGGAFTCGDLIFRPSEVLTILYETKAEIIKRILPPPLVPYEKPYVIIAYNNFKDVNFDAGLRGPGYRETALYIPATYEGKMGTYVAAMTLNTDLGTIMGREIAGYPKKVGTVDHYYKDDRYVAFSARHGIPYATLEGILDGEPNDPAFLTELGKVLTSDPSRPGFGINWTFKWTPGLNGDVFMTTPLLVEGWKSKKDLAPSRIGKGNVQLIWSDDDPWAEFEVVRVLGAVLVNVESRMYLQDIVTHPVDAKAFEPYAFFGYDVMPASAFNPKE
ncbi:MAG: acetoacetate decarboxylase family protein [Christensenellaceae bacterium]|jgi:acetoacetate decarboxylase